MRGRKGKLRCEVALSREGGANHSSGHANLRRFEAARRERARLSSKLIVFPTYCGREVRGPVVDIGGARGSDDRIKVRWRKLECLSPGRGAN